MEEKGHQGNSRSTWEDNRNEFFERAGMLIRKVERRRKGQSIESDMIEKLINTIRAITRTV